MRTTDKGFTLIELMVAISLFMVVMVISMTAIIGVFDANRKSRSIRTALNNLNLAVESMSREMRFGKDYFCSTNPAQALPGQGAKQDCGSGANPPGSLIRFTSSDVDIVINYRLLGTIIEKRIDRPTAPPAERIGPWVPMTGSEVSVQELKLYVIGSGSVDGLQPKILMQIKGYSGQGKGRSDFALQTLISQRLIDN